MYRSIDISRDELSCLLACLPEARPLLERIGAAGLGLVVPPASDWAPPRATRRTASTSSISKVPLLWPRPGSARRAPEIKV